MKKCGKCLQIKSLECFTVKNKTKKSFVSYCKECNKQYQKEHYKNNKKYYKSKRKERKDNLREQFQEFKKTLNCNRCPENHPSALDFHHINPEKKECGIAELITRGWSIERIKKEIEKCEVLCANCHRKEHYGPII